MWQQYSRVNTPPPYTACELTPPSKKKQETLSLLNELYN